MKVVTDKLMAIGEALAMVGMAVFLMSAAAAMAAFAISAWGRVWAP